ncbi:MAG TPA: glycoside hydrolase family 3 C-terminal domain-containing protein [Verrucomicrobiae bacterium]|jgi:beta-glucosidase|nr:glycoside hydrolase family 3 C-terminal domain-containing protein [Verrucomicrobiae bacterium]
MAINFKVCALSVGSIIFLSAGAAVALAQDQTNDFDARARQIVSEMTLQEKITELHGIHDAVHQRYVPPIPRLGIPGFRIANGPAGVGPGDEHHQLPATALPAPIDLAATWDPDLARQYGVVIGLEAKALDDDLLEGPDINIARVPQNGRTFEAFGEDPYLVTQIAVAEIQGIQSQGEIANVKHYAANNQETERFTVNELVGERALREIYLPAFEASVEEGHVASVMSAYPKVNDQYCCQNEILQNQILKKQWGFRGFITSDFGAVHSTIPSAMAGLDLEMPTGKYFGDALAQAVGSGHVPISVIDDKLVRRFRTMMQYGLFDHPSGAMKSIPEYEDGQKALKIAEEGMVLLKNEGNLLPLNTDKVYNIALIGSDAMKAMTGGEGSSHVLPLYSVSPQQGIERRAGSMAKVQLADGKDIRKAVALAASADLAIVMVGDQETEGKDHPITLPGNEDELIAAVAAANPHTVVVLKSGSVVLMPWVDKVPAILEAWYPGEEDGNAVAAVLFGDVNPSGKLPITFPKQLADLPANTEWEYPGVQGVVRYSEGIFVGYRHYDKNHIQPLFPFGYGLSYTTFQFSNLSVSPAKVKNDKPFLVTVDFDLTNTGKRAGEEVAQLYVGLPSTSRIPQPPEQLKRFAKVLLQPGETRHVQFELDKQALSCWSDRQHKWEVLAGPYQIMVGPSSRHLPLQGVLTIHSKHLLGFL